MTDGELVRQTLAGTTSAYGTLAVRWSARILAVCHARVGRQAAEDLAQEALLRGLRSLPTLTDPEKFGSWVMGIAVRVCLDWLKSARRSEVSLDVAGAAQDAADMKAAVMEATASDLHERARRLMYEVEQLPLIYREAIMLYYYKHCTYQELADLLGVSAATINVRLTKARAMLRQRMMAERE